ncbi:glycoside hydrolase [Dactylonectria estremocensis]|uniref:alpha-1,2-Mannosidase n=1 Tax=Dactylonectria estremocensis TaxID=1079267 RepID=A0A9P9F1P8_9HYPO|nr:glycoside hydrolase [Dactylonectria estremocensis]
MMAQCQGRLSRRYIALIVLVGVGYFLYHNLQPPHYMRTTQVGAVKYLNSSYDWSKNPVYFPVEDIKSPPATDQSEKLPPVQHQWSESSENDVSLARKAAVKKAFVKSWNAYKTYAWPQDELKPLSRKGKQSFSGWSAQIVDALDTLWLLDMQADFKLAVEQVALIDWATTSDEFLNLFEVTIRHLGGLLAAYDLSGEHVLLAKAIELGDMLYATFDTPNRLPSHWLYFAKAKEGKQTADDSMSGAAGCSMGLEFTRLSQITGDPKYYDATERVKQFIYRNQNETKLPGLWPHTMNYRKETVTASMFTVGAGADSLYEYLPKMHAILGGLDPEYVQMTTLALDTATKHLLYKPINPNDTNILMAGNVVASNGKIELTTEMQHLTCFIGGTYGLAGKLLSRDDFVELGSRLTAGCVWAYDSFPTNIMPEIAELKPCPSIDGECRYEDLKPASSQLPPGFTRVRDPRYLLRPEAIESVFYMWRITGDELWRDAAWRMWEGIVKEAENDLAFASVTDVRYEGSTQDDAMETFWMSETLKYFWLIFDDHKVLNLDDWVLNTEAHPFKRPSS